MPNASAGSVFRGITWFRSTLSVGFVYPLLPVIAQVGVQGSHERRLLSASTAQAYGVSEATLYRALAERMRPKAMHRADRGVPRRLPVDEMERYCELVAANKVRTSNKKGRHLSTSQSIRLLEVSGVSTSDGFVELTIGTLKKAITRYNRTGGSRESE